MKMLSIADMTLGEAELFEEHSGLAVMELSRRASSSEDGEVELPLKAITALLWLSRRREDPEVTIEQVREVKVTDMALDFGDDEEDDEPDGS